MLGESIFASLGWVALCFAAAGWVLIIVPILRDGAPGEGPSRLALFALVVSMGCALPSLHHPNGMRALFLSGIPLVVGAYSYGVYFFGQFTVRRILDELESGATGSAPSPKGSGSVDVPAGDQAGCRPKLVLRSETPFVEDNARTWGQRLHVRFRVRVDDDRLQVSGVAIRRGLTGKRRVHFEQTHTIRCIDEKLVVSAEGEPERRDGALVATSVVTESARDGRLTLAVEMAAAVEPGKGPTVSGATYGVRATIAFPSRALALRKSLGSYTWTCEAPDGARATA